MKFLLKILILMIYQICKIDSSINFGYNIYNSSQQIISISEGLTHLTIVSTSINNPTIINV
jgi:hypothetical protein